MDISLSLLSYYENQCLEKLDAFQSDLKFLHLDVMDGKFVNNITFDYKLIEELRKKYAFFFDTHIMIEHPEKFIKNYVKAGSDCITFHYEASSNPESVINLIHSYGIKAGISIKPNTNIQVLKPLLSKVDMVLVMSVEPGFGGQKFLPNSIDKVKWLKEERNQNRYNYKISIDGGINEEKLLLVKNDVDLAVCGSYITKSEDPVKRFKMLSHI